MNYEVKEEIIRIENVSMHYDKPILDDINLSIKNIVRPGVHQGQISALIGKSGIGKSQLLRILAGLQKPTNGKIFINGQESSLVGKVGVVPQQCTLFPHRTVMSNLQLAISQSGQKRDISDLVKMFNLDEHLKKWPSELSGGQRQRVSILQQILVGNKILLMDEPFSGLDCIMIDKVLNLLKTITQLDEALTLIIVSHDTENTLSICDSAFIISKPDSNKGATITKSYDLAKEGLAWTDNIRESSRFKEIIKEIKTIL